MKALTTYRDMAFLSKELAQIRKDYPIPQTLDDFKLSFDKDKAKEQFEKYGFKSLMDKI